MATTRPKSTAHGMLDDEYWSRFTSNFDDYQLGAPIGFGASSIVYASTFTPPLTSASSSSTHVQSESSTKPRGRPRPALHIDVGTAALPAGQPRPCAIKISGLHSDIDQLFRETKLLGLSRHPNVLRILAAFTLPPDHRRVAIVTPLVAGGSLAGILKWRASTYRDLTNGHGFLSRKSATAEIEVVQGSLDEDEIKSVVKQVLEGLIYLHTNGYLHRDLKAGNLLLDQDGKVLLADFGVAGDTNEPPSLGATAIPAAEDVRFDRKIPHTTLESTRRPSFSRDVGKRRSFVGTPSWMAPEVILGQKYDSKADIWSLGMTILELAHGQMPYSQSSAKDVLVMIVSQPPPSLDKSSGFTKTMRDFVELCLQKDPGRRPLAGELADHHWLKGAKGSQFLARSLLTDVLPLEQRQELRRVPTVSSLTSLTSSWDFNSPSLPASPARSSFSKTVLRSPSIISQLQEYFPLAQSGSRSRTVSIYSALPPSPSIPLRQWAERSASVGPSPSAAASPAVLMPPEARRTGSERGRKRTEGEVGQSLRRGHSASFDMHLQRPSGAMTRPTPRTRQFADISPKTSLARLGRSEVDSEDATVPGPMSPVIEATASAQSMPQAEAGQEPISESPTALSSPTDFPLARPPIAEFNLHGLGRPAAWVIADEYESNHRRSGAQEDPHDIDIVQAGLATVEVEHAIPSSGDNDVLDNRPKVAIGVPVGQKQPSPKKKGWMRRPSVRKVSDEKGKERSNGHHGLISTLSTLGLGRRS